MKYGVTVGKFLPFHLGHKHLIETASQQCDDLTVLICFKESDPIPVDTRFEWMSEEFAGRLDIHFWPIDQDQLGLDDNDSEGWGRETLNLLGFTPDVAFTSESYGPHWADCMGCEHRFVDPDRTIYPVSGTRVRANPTAYQDLLPPQVWAYYCPRILIVGAESTGKTTLAHDLQFALGGTVVEEFGRFYTEAMPDPSRYEWTREDFDIIAETQDKFEDQAARWAKRLICDTNSFTTGLFQEVYLDKPAVIQRTVGLDRKYDLVVLTDPETPFEDDSTGLRDETKRAWFHQQYEDAYPDAIRVSGDETERVRQVLERL